MKNRIWGIEYEEHFDPVDGRYIWIAHIDKKFFFNSNYVVGINEKFIKEARKKNVILRVRIGEGEEIPVSIPLEKEIKLLTKTGAYEDKESKFENGAPMRIYYIKV